MEIDEEIKSLRHKIDTSDDEILSHLNRRAELVSQMGRIKLSNNLRIYDPRREEEIINRLRMNHCGPFPERAIFHVFREIISACRSLEKNINVAYLGPSATHTHLACLEHFGNSIEAFPKDSIEEVFEAVERGETYYGVVPVENSTEGIVNQTLDMFVEYEVKICGEVLLRISHDLLSKNGKVEDIEKIYSHPQAFEQCRKRLRKTFPQVRLIETASTAKAAQLAAEDPKTAAIANTFAAHIYGLKVIESQIEDYLNNCTRFLILSREGGKRTKRDKTSLLLTIPHTPGSLYQALRPFSEQKVNLTKIESRPVKGRPWEYVFFLDFEGHTTDTNIIETMAELNKNVLFLKVLGSYPRNHDKEGESQVR